jgi:hypothetical protein
MSTMDAPLFLHFLAALISTIHECTGDDWISGTQSINLASVGPNREPVSGWCLVANHSFYERTN